MTFCSLLCVNRAGIKFRVFHLVLIRNIGTKISMKAFEIKELICRCSLSATWPRPCQLSQVSQDEAFWGLVMSLAGPSNM